VIQLPEITADLAYTECCQVWPEPFPWFQHVGLVRDYGYEATYYWCTYGFLWQVANERTMGHL